MANTPKYTFVEQDPFLPALQGVSTALGGIAAERNASKKQKERLTRMSDVLASQGLMGDAQIYRALADSEEPDFLTAALSGRAVPRDISKPFDHALDAIQGKANRQATLEAAGIRSGGTGTRMTLAEQRQRDVILADELRANQSDADRLEREIYRTEQELAQVAQSGGDVSVLEDELNRKRQDHAAALNRIKDTQETRRKQADLTFGNGSEASAGGPTGSYTQDSVNNPNLNAELFSADETGNALNAPSTLPENAPDQFSAPFSATDGSDQSAIKPEDDQLIPTARAVPKPTAIDGGSLMAPAKTTEPDPTGIAFKGQSTFAGEEKTPEQAAAKSSPEIPKSFTQLAEASLSSNASKYKRQSALMTANAKDVAVASGVPRDLLEQPKTVKEVETAIRQYNRSRGFAQEKPTIAEATQEGQQIAAASPDGDKLMVWARPGPGGGFLPVVQKKTGIISQGGNNWISQDGTITWRADDAGVMYQRNLQTGEEFPLFDPDNPNARLSKEKFISAAIGLNNSSARGSGITPQSTDATKKQINRGVPAAAPTNLRDQFQKQSTYDRFNSQPDNQR